jgi:hypothetical protein
MLQRCGRALRELKVYTLRGPGLGPLDAIWHLLNFFAPAIGVGCLVPLMAKLLWRRELRGSLLRLSLWTTLAGALGLVAALVLLGRDGKMAGYGLMVVAAAVGLWWAGLRSRAT